LALLLQESHIVLEIVVPFGSPTRRLIELSGLQSIAAVVLVDRPDSSQVGPVELVLPAQPRVLKNIRHSLRRWLSGVGASPYVIDDVLIAVGEACTNVVDHAYRTERGTVHVHLGLQGPDLVATIADTGQWGQPSAGNRGRGTLLMRHCSDDLRIDHGPTGTTVVIRRHLIEEETQ
jgi:anti-sigma regulatory factor (Ser/Thr protein kinase)